MVKLLVCDLDESYLDALVKFILTSDEGIEVTCYSDMIAYGRCSGDFDVVLMGQVFYREMGDRIRGKICVQLLGTNDTPIAGMEYIYKFQSMDSFMKKLQEYSLSNGRKLKDEGKTRVVGIFSPSHHMHTSSFSYVYAKLCREYGKVLLVNLGENPGFNYAFFQGKKNIVDYIYELTGNAEDVPLAEFVENFKGIQCLLPARDPEEIWELGEAEWAKLVTELRGSIYDVVLLVFGEFGRYFFDLIGYIDDLMLVGGDDKYSLTTNGRFKEYLVKRGCMVDVQDVVLNKELCDRISKYDLDVILSGNLAEWLNGIRRDCRYVAVG